MGKTNSKEPKTEKPGEVGKNSKEYRREMCVNPDAAKEFSMAQVEFTLETDTTSKQVSLQDLRLRLTLPPRRNISARICSVSDDVYLFSDYSENCITKLELSSGKTWFQNVHGSVEGLFILEQNRVAVVIKKQNLVQVVQR